MAPKEHGSLAENDQTIQFIVNGKIYKVGSKVPPSTSLLQFLRDFASLPGTKGCCYEGGCGVCTVVATFIDPETGKEKTCSVNSCQTPVYSCTGWAIETIERLGDRYRGYHSLQKALVGFYGTQCGYCSPGFVMTMYGELKSFGRLTTEQVEKSLDGNICRCTGYRPILDAFKSLTVDAPEELSKKLMDIEDSYKATCPKTGELCKGECPDNASKDNGCSSNISTENIRPNSDVHLAVGDINWHRPLTLKGVYKILQEAPSSQSVQIVVGNTGEGIYKNDGLYDLYVDTTGVENLYAVAIGKPLVIGANVSLQRCVHIFRQMAKDYTGYGHLEELANHWEMVANLNVRNVGSWVGNLMLKHKHKEFPSDIFVTLAVADAIIKVGHAVDSSTSEVRVEDLMNLDMARNFILSMKLPPQEENTIIRTYKISPRTVNSHAYVNSAFKFQVDPEDGYKLLSKPVLIFGGINPSFVHATKAEEFLTSRRLSAGGILKRAVKIIGEELKPQPNPLDASPAYRISLSQGLFYKAILNILGNAVSPELRSGGTVIKRPISSGRQKFDPNEDSWPVGQPVPKIESNIQVSGEAEYVDDMDPANGELHGAFVQSTFANAELNTVDPSEALKVPGVVSYIDASDIPGTNNFYPSGYSDPVFISSQVQYGGQSIGLIVAENKTIAQKAAKLVKVQYKNVKKPILTIKEALNKPPNPSKAFENAAHTVEGEFEQGSQFHLTMEPLATRVIPVEDGYDVFCTTQWPNNVQAAISDVLGISNNSINVSVRRLGGGFGCKISRSNLVACAAAVASHKLHKPVRITLDLDTHMTLVGWRDPYMTKYKVGFDDDGSLKRVEVELISDAGFNPNEATAYYAYKWVPNVYYSVGWNFSSQVVKTNTAANTYCRTPGTPGAIASMENIIERVAAFLKKDPAEIREKNFINKKEHKTQAISPKGENTVRTIIFPMLKKEANYDARRAEVDQFNATHRWKKRGLSMIPLYYGLDYPKSFRYNTQVVIYAKDGTVVVTHGGIEMGQGINTKAAQVTAKFLGVPLNFIKVKATNLITGANSSVTGGSLGSDLVAHGIQKCCENLRNRIDVVEKKIEKRKKYKPSWVELIQACLALEVDLSERFWTSSPTHPASYDIFAAACMEVEVDVLTGQYIMLRSDIIEDCGRSLSPYVDIGQVEGAFIMGLGLYTSEIVKYDPNTGQKLTNSTWDYKPPTALDIPVDLRITLLPKGDNKYGVLRSKATGEPALCLAYSIVTALRDAIKSTRTDMDDIEWFEMTTPLTVEKIQQLCKVDPTRFILRTRDVGMEDKEEDFHVVEKHDVPQLDEASCSVH